ncbi:hypothetical protein LguiA_006812 [Lonicera macranthoides]
MEMAANDVPNMPKSYSLNMFKDFVPMCVFSESNQGWGAMDGKVEHKFDMKPNNENMEGYRKMCRERTNKSMIKNRQIQVIDNDRGVHMRPMPGMVGLIASNSKDRKKATPVKGRDVKRTRRDRGELEDIMFKLFERQPNWALKQLVQETDQPAQFLKEILNELCVYNKRGANQGTCELKPEYKKSVEDTSAELGFESLVTRNKYVSKLCVQHFDGSPGKIAFRELSRQFERRITSLISIELCRKLLPRVGDVTGFKDPRPI